MRINKNTVKHLEAVMAQMKAGIAELDELVRSLRQEDVPTARTSVVRKPAKSQAKKTAKAKPAVKTISDKRIESQASKPVAAKKSVAVDGNEVTLNVGAFAVKALAEADAAELLNTRDVFTRRSVVFPSPRAYQVQPTITYTRVVHLTSKAFLQNPWGVNVTISVLGEDKNVKAWINATLAKCKAYQER